MLANGRDILAQLTQRRHLDLDDIQPVIQVLAKLVLLHALGQIVMCCTDDAHVHGLFAGRPHFAHALLLDHAQQLDLHGQRQIRDLVQKQCPAVRSLEKTVAVFVSTGECAFLVTEEFAFHQILRDRPAVHCDYGLIAARAALHDEPRCQLLAAARFAADMHRCLTARHAGYQITHLLHGRRGAQQSLAG